MYLLVQFTYFLTIPFMILVEVSAVAKCFFEEEFFVFRVCAMKSVQNIFGVLSKLLF